MAARTRQTGAVVGVLACLSLIGCAELAYRHMNDPARDTWQKPHEVVGNLAVAPGSKIADLGAGGGYFTWHLAGSTGPSGTIYAVEIDDTALNIIKRDMAARNISNVVPIRAEPTDAKLPEPVDLVFSCDTYHHMGDRVAYFRSLARYLKPNGRIAILDYHPRGFFSGLLGHGTAKEEVRREMESAGYRLTNEYDLVESQHFQVFSRQGS
jgi:predicted methyltransferase